MHKVIQQLPQSKAMNHQQMVRECLELVAAEIGENSDDEEAEGIFDADMDRYKQYMVQIDSIESKKDQQDYDKIIERCTNLMTRNNDQWKINRCKRSLKRAIKRLQGNKHDEY